MLRLPDNAKRLFTTPGMFSAYCNWVLARTVSSTGPTISFTSNTQIQGWLNFSEYWSFRQGITKAEKILMQRSLSNASPNQAVGVDIGANIGLFSVTLAGIGYSKVHAFEPIPETFARLEANVNRNQLLDKVRLNCKAIGSQKGFIEFQIFENAPAINRILSFGSNQREQVSTQQVPVTTLDEYCDESKINKIEFLKIDVEGMEPLVFKGANSLLKSKSVSSILLEICPNNLEMAGFSINELHDSILSVGYLPYMLLESGHTGDLVTLDALKNITLANVLVLPTHK